MKRFLFVLVLAATPAAVRAAGVEADPNKTYVVTPEAGPWLICVTHYPGPEGKQLARELALEIRRRDQIPAYIYDRGEEQRRQQAEERERLRQMYPEADLRRFRTTRIPDECVVLVGGYKDMETARRELEKVKKLKPPPEKLMQFVSEVRPVGGEGNRGEIWGTHLNPFPNSFVARNPLVPAEKPVANKSEYQLLKHLNANEDYSLLKCRQPWTLVVATFQGTSMIQSASTSTSFLDRIWNRNPGEVLAASGQNAHNMAQVLSHKDVKLGFEVYVLHRRNDSLVTIGGFSGPEDPRMRQAHQAISRLRIGEGVKFLPQPLPLEVPRP